MLDFLGISEKFPLQPNMNSGVELVADFESINQSINDILSTPIGLRFFNEYYGSNLHYLQFEPNDSVFRALAIYFSFDAITKWEKRIKLKSVDVQMETEKSFIILPYNVIQGNQEGNFIYPFYREIIQ